MAYAKFRRGYHCILKGKGDTQHVGYRIGMEQQSQDFIKGCSFLIPSVPIQGLHQKEEADGDHDGYEGWLESLLAEVVSADVDGSPYGQRDYLPKYGELGCCLFLQFICRLFGLLHSNYKVEQCHSLPKWRDQYDDIIVLAINISPDCMNRSQRKIAGGFDVSLQLAQRSLIINITHPSKNRVYFSRISDSSLPAHLREIADNSKQLYELMVDLNEEKLAMSGNDELVIMMDVGKKVKQYVIPLEKVEISSEEALKKRVEDLEKELERKEFQAKFYKEQYHFLLQNLQLKPDTQELERIYKRDMQFVFEKQAKMMKSQSMFEKESEMTMSSISAKSQKVGSFEREKKQVLKCPKMHPLISELASHPYFKCNLCRRQIPQGQLNYQCRPCDFDACGNCISTPPQNQKYCPKQHMISFGCAKNYLTRSCDLCRSSLAFTKAYTCLECDYDVCRNCLK